MSLPLPFVIIPDDKVGGIADDIQANFDVLKNQFPLGRRHMQIESPHIVGAAGEPAFQNGWVNWGLGYEVTRFWKDPMGIVRIEGLVTAGGLGTTIFTLPAGYRPANRLIFVNYSDTGAGRVDVTSAGDVIHTAGGNNYYSINISFKQEQ
jgi:hypothetical protein